MNKVVKGILSALAGFVSIIGILLIALVIWATGGYGINIGGIVFLIISGIVSFLTGWVCVRGIRDLLHPERVQQRKGAKEEQLRIKQMEKDNVKAEKDKKQEEFYAQERLRRDEEYRLFSEAKSKMEKEQKEKELEYREKEQVLAEGDIAQILKANEGGPVYRSMILSRILVGILLMGALLFVLTSTYWLRKYSGVQVASGFLLWFAVLAIVFVASMLFSGVYKGGLLQVLMKTTKGRVYYAMVYPRYKNVSQSNSKIKRLVENNEVLEENRKFHQIAREYMESEEFRDVLTAYLHRKPVDAAEEVRFIYLQDYQVKRGLLQNTIYYTDEKTNKKAKVSVYKGIELP